MKDVTTDLQDIDVLSLLPVADGDPSDGAQVSLGSDPSPRRLRWLAVFSCLVALAGAVAVVAKGADSSNDGPARLAAARAAVADAGSYSYELRRTSSVQTGDPDGAGSDVTTRTLTTGTVAAADRWHIVDDTGDAYFGSAGEPYELIRVGGDLFEKGGYDDAPDGVDAPAWIRSPAGEPMTVDDVVEMYSFATEEGAFEGIGEGDDAFEAQWRLDVTLGAFLLPVETDPANLHRLVDAAADPVVEERLADGGTRLRTTLAPIPEVAEATGDDVDPVDLVLDLDRDDLPTAARFSVATDGASSAIDVRFTDWGSELAVAAPDAADVDQTPWIMEEALEAVDPDLLVAPTDLPDGLLLTGADIYEYEDDCYELDLTYSDEAESTLSADMTEEEFAEVWERIPYLSITVLSRECSDDLDDSGFDDTFAGLPSRGDAEWLEVVVGDVVVTVDNDVDDDTLAALVASLRPTTPEALAASIPEWARAWAVQGWAVTGGAVAVGSDPA